MLSVPAGNFAHDMCHHAHVDRAARAVILVIIEDPSTASLPQRPQLDLVGMGRCAVEERSQEFQVALPGLITNHANLRF